MLYIRAAARKRRRYAFPAVKPNLGVEEMTTRPCLAGFHQVREEEGRDTSTSPSQPELVVHAVLLSISQFQEQCIGNLKGTPPILTNSPGVSDVDSAHLLVQSLTRLTLNESRLADTSNRLTYCHRCVKRCSSDVEYSRLIGHIGHSYCVLTSSC